MSAYRRRRVLHLKRGLAVAGAVGVLASCGGHSTVSVPAASPPTSASARPATDPTTSATRPPSTPSTALTTTSTGGARTILAPATVAPVTDECSLKLTDEADGNVVPLLCPAGGVNTTAWAHYAKGNVGSGPVTPSKTLAIGRAATAAQVRDAMCVDFRAVYGTKPLTISAERLAAAYYGWAFSSDDPVNSFELTGCGPS